MIIMLDLSYKINDIKNFRINITKCGDKKYVPGDKRYVTETSEINVGKGTVPNIRKANCKLKKNITCLHMYIIYFITYTLVE